MKILKYLIGLLFLFTNAVVIFVLVDSSEINIKKTQFLQVKKVIVVPFFSKFDFWTTEKIAYTLAPNAQYDLLKFEFDDQEYSAQIKFKDSLDGTLIELKTRRKLTFFEKFNLMYFGEHKEKVLNNFLQKQLMNLNNNLVEKLNYYDFSIATVFEFPSAYVIEKDTLVSRDFTITSKQKLLNDLRLIAYQNKFTIDAESLFYISNEGKKTRIKAQKSVPFDSLWIDSLPKSIILRKPNLVLKLEVKGVFKGFANHKKNIDQTLDSLNYKVISYSNYFEIEKINIQNSPMPFEWITTYYLPIEKKVNVYYIEEVKPN
jgi:hypothetical protein